MLVCFDVVVGWGGGGGGGGGQLSPLGKGFHSSFENNSISLMTGDWLKIPSGSEDFKMLSIYFHFFIYANFPDQDLPNFNNPDFPIGIPNNHPKS